MPSPDTEAIRKAIQSATEMVRDLPEELRQVAFTKAFDALVSQNRTNDSGTPAVAPTQDAPEPQAEDIDRTRWYPLIARLNTVLSKSLLVMRALREDAQVEWSSPAQVHRILTERLRQIAKPGAVRMSLMRAGRFADRRERGGVVEYRLMAPGDAELDRLLAQETPKATMVRSKAKRTTSPTTATKAVGSLIGGGYFTSERTVAEVIEHLAKKKALNFRQEDIAITLMRAVRRGDLDREKNGDGIYSYKTHPTSKDEFVEGIIGRNDREHS